MQHRRKYCIFHSTLGHIGRAGFLQAFRPHGTGSSSATVVSEDHRQTVFFTDFPTCHFAGLGRWAGEPLFTAVAPPRSHLFLYPLPCPNTNKENSCLPSVAVLSYYDPGILLPRHLRTEPKRHWRDGVRLNHIHPVTSEHGARSPINYRSARP